MLPSQLTTSEFETYPPQARQLATSRIELLRELPLSFVPLLLQELSEYDWKFPAEQKYLDRQFVYLASLSPAERRQVLAGFAEVKISSGLERFDWVKSPGIFSERLSAYLWATHQIDTFRAAAGRYIQKLDASMAPQPLPAPRLAIVVLGQGVEQNTYKLFRKLRAHGVYFNRVKPDNGLRILLNAAAARAAAHPIPYGHWYIDGAASEPVPGNCLTCISYDGLKPVRMALLNRIEKAIRGGISGPEALRTMLHQMRPEEIGLSGRKDDAVLSHFQTRLLTDGSGTQIYSTTFVQWGAREVLRRAQPLTVVARFAPRQRQRPMNEMLSGKNQNPEPDPTGSLIDADMGAYLTWLDQQRLSGAEQSSFLVWFEDHNEALAITPSLPRGTEASDPVDLQWLVGQMGLKTACNENAHQPPSTAAAALRPPRHNYVLEATENDEDMVDFLNAADYKSSRSG